MFIDRVVGVGLVVQAAIDQERASTDLTYNHPWSGGLGERVVGQDIPRSDAIGHFRIVHEAAARADWNAATGVWLNHAISG